MTARALVEYGLIAAGIATIFVVGAVAGMVAELMREPNWPCDAWEDEQ